MFRYGIGFIRNRSERLIVDEAQYMPDLFPMIQVAVGKQQGAPESQRHVVLRIERIFRREVLTRILQRDG